MRPATPASRPKVQPPTTPAREIWLTRNTSFATARPHFVALGHTSCEQCLCVRKRTRLTRAGNTLIFDELRYTRRHVNATLPWPSEAVASRPRCDAPAQSILASSLAADLDDLRDQQVVWVGALFNVTDLNRTMTDKLAMFNKEIQLCPEC